MTNEETYSTQENPNIIEVIRCKNCIFNRFKDGTIGACFRTKGDEWYCADAIKYTEE